MSDSIQTMAEMNGEAVIPVNHLYEDNSDYHNLENMQQQHANFYDHPEFYPILQENKYRPIPTKNISRGMSYLFIFLISKLISLITILMVITIRLLLVLVRASHHRIPAKTACEAGHHDLPSQPLSNQPNHANMKNGH